MGGVASRRQGLMRLSYVPPITTDGKESACNAGDPGSIPGSGRSPGEGSGYPLQHSCLENPADGGAWRAAVHKLKRAEYDRVTHAFIITRATSRVTTPCVIINATDAAATRSVPAGERLAPGCPWGACSWQRRDTTLQWQ